MDKELVVFESDNLLARIRSGVKPRDDAARRFVVSSRSLFKGVPESMLRYGAMQYVDCATRTKLVTSVSKSLSVALTTRRTTATVMSERIFGQLLSHRKSANEFVAAMVSYWHSLGSETTVKFGWAHGKDDHHDSAPVAARFLTVLRVLHERGARLERMSLDFDVVSHCRWDPWLSSHMTTVRWLCCTLSGDASLSRVFPRLSDARELTKLTLSYELTAQNINYLCDSGVLQRLTTFGFGSNTYAGVHRVLTRMQRVKTLIVKLPRHNFDDIIVPAIADMRHLTRLTLEASSYHVVALITRLARHKMPRLTHLHIKNNLSRVVYEDDALLLAVVALLQTYDTDSALRTLSIPPLQTVQGATKLLYETMDLGAGIKFAFKVADKILPVEDATLVPRWISKHPRNKTLSLRQYVPDNLHSLPKTAAKRLALYMTEASKDVIGTVGVATLDLALPNVCIGMELLRRHSAINRSLRKLVLRQPAFFKLPAPSTAYYGLGVHLCRRLPFLREFVVRGTTEHDWSMSNCTRIEIDSFDLVAMIEHPSLTRVEVDHSVCFVPDYDSLNDHRALGRALNSTSLPLHKRVEPFSITIRGAFASLKGEYKQVQHFSVQCVGKRLHITC